MRPPPPTWPEAVETVGVWFAVATIVWAIAWWLANRNP
jgi:hypothetical protein